MLPALLVLAAAAAPPHVVFFLVDDLGWNDVGFHGSAQIPTPNLDRLAHAGVILDNYYVNPVCSPTRASLMSGRSMIHTGIQTPYGFGQHPSGLNLTYTLLPEQLKLKANYTSYMIGKWHLGMKTKEYLPSARGYDKYYGYYLGHSDAWKFYQTPRDEGNGTGTPLDLHEGGRLLGLAPGEDRPVYDAAGVYTTERYAAVASEWVAAHDQAQPMFMYVAFQGIHSSNSIHVQAPEDLIARFDGHISGKNETCGQYDLPMSGACTKRAMRKTVAAEVVAVDAAVARVEAALGAAGMLENTLMVFSTDNGGPTDGTNSNMANNFPLRSGKGELWEGGIRGVGFLTGAGLKKTGYASTVLHHVSDWYRTILAAAGVDSAPTLGPKEVPWKAGDGVDNWAALSTGAASGAREELVIAAQAPGSVHEAHGIRVGDWKLLWHPELGYNMPGWYTPPGLPWNYSDTLTVKCGPPPVDGPSSDNMCEDEATPCLYNITADPCEYRNLATAHPDVVATLKARLAEYSKTTVLPWSNFAHFDADSVPTAPDVPIPHDAFAGGSHVYAGVWEPWLTADEERASYPTNYTGPGY